MTDEDIPSSDHVVRYIKPTLVRDDGRADGSSFALRNGPTNETGLSVNWLEVLGAERGIQLSSVRNLSRLQLRTNGRFAELNVGTVLEHVREELESLRIVQDPLVETDDFDADPSHAVMKGLPHGDSDQAMLVGDLIANCVITMHPALD